MILSTRSALCQSVRLEIEAKSINESYYSIPVNKNGIILFFQPHVKTTSLNKEIWILSKYDTTFEEIWSTEVALQSLQNYLAHDVYQDRVYILFGKKNFFQILAVDIETGEYEVLKGKTSHEEYEVSNFKVAQDFAFFTGITPPSQNLVFYRSVLSFLCFPLSFVPGFIPTKSVFMMHYNMASKISKDINIDTKGSSEALQLVHDTLTGKVVLCAKNISGKNSTVMLYEYKYSGAKTKNIALKPIAKQYQLLDARICAAKPNERVVIGTYGNNRSNGCQGIYFSKILAGKQDFIHYHSFSNFKHFFEYLEKPDKQKIEKKITQKKSRGKDINLNYQIMLHDIIADTQKYVIAAEVYKPLYHTEYQMIWSYGRPIETAIEIFDGYKYTHAIIAAFNNMGELIWDNSLIINDITSFTLAQKVKCTKDSAEKYTLAYNNLGTVQYKIIKDSTTLEEKSVADYSFKEEDRTQFDFYSDIDYWYDNYFITYGSQSYKNREEDYVRKRKIIYYFNKIQLNVK
ncbi:MAG: hypothetical protein NW207_02400 [Cytophagales bacterium]|nr:hypothetical protein [Cytophagales bacterium]